MPIESVFEGSKGLFERVQPLVRFPIFMRVVLPGAFATGVLYPFTGSQTDFLSADWSNLWRELVLLLIACFFLGAIISAFSDPIYKIFEGKAFWPDFLFDLMQTRQSRKIKRLLTAAEDAKAKKRMHEHEKIWHDLRMATTRRLTDLFRFPGFRPYATARGVFGDPKARVLRLERRGKKAAAECATRWCMVSTTARFAAFAICLAGMPAFTWSSNCGVSGVGAVVR